MAAPYDRDSEEEDAEASLLDKLIFFVLIFGATLLLGLIVLVR